jgi:hypothetical protein
MPTGTRLADLCEVRTGIVRVTDCEHSRIGVGGKRIDCIEDRLRDAARLVDHDERIQCMDALKCRLIMVSGLASKGDQLLAARSHVPLVIECDSAGERSLAMRLTDIPPEDRVHLLGRRSRRGRKRIVVSVEPPRDDA